jgi:hypothetical protein
MKKALVIGINDYPTAPLYGCVNDATEFSKLIESNEDNSPNFEVKLALNLDTKAEIKKMIVELYSGDCDTSILYFSGHGFLDELGGYIVTRDFKQYDEGISMDDILNLANQSKIRDRIIILDCCHSGAFGSPVMGGKLSYLKEGVTILTACRDYQTAIEFHGHGVFTNLLLSALKGGAADLNGNISPGSVYAYIDQALGAFDQRPVFKTNVTRFTSLRKVKPQVPVGVLREIIKYFPTPDHEFSLDPSNEDTNSIEVIHNVIEPYANPDHVGIFKKLQKFQSVGIVVPVGAEFMYFAAMESKSCKLTPLGHHYWRLVNKKRI